MKKVSYDTAILLFSLASEKEAKSKKIVANQAGNLDVITYLHCSTLKKVESTGLPFFTISKQVGTHFGDRLATAIQEIFDQGFHQVITIGNDCGDLSSSDLLRADQLLKTHGSVIGPDERKGVYLIGLSKNHWNRAKFSSLRWQSDYTCSDLKSFLGDPSELTTKKDLNHVADLVQFLKHTSRKVKRMLWTILSPTNRIDKTLNSLYNFLDHSSVQHRGPPLPITLTLAI